jgi:integrase
MGLGSYDDGINLSDARDARDEARRILRSGRNPIHVRREERRAEQAKQTFGEVADELIAAKSSEWRSARHSDQWRSSLVEAAAALRPKPIDEIDTEAVLSVLKPIWADKPESASRLRQRIEAVLDAGKAKGLRDGENPARWRGHLAHLLPKRTKLARGHHGAMPYGDIPAFMTRLRENENIAARALEFAILTAGRSGEIFGAKWAEINLEANVWTIPPERMKAAREHRVPLSSRAVAILEKLIEMKTGDVVFESPRGGQLSHIAMQKVLARMGMKGATVHGMRSAFRDWAGNETHFPREIAEAALAHVVGDAAEQAYRRSDALEKRRELMTAWANYCEPKGGSNIVKLAQQRP